MATDGTQQHASRSGSAVGPVVTLLFACLALLAISKRKPSPGLTPVEPEPIAETPSPEAPSAAPEAHETPHPVKRPRFLLGALAGISTGIALGATAAALITLAGPDVRSGVIVGTGLHAPPPNYDGVVSARILAQDMNPTLVYAEAEVAQQFAPAPYEPPPVTIATAAGRLEDNAELVFAVLGALTIASWGLITLGLMSGPPVLNAGVE